MKIFDGSDRFTRGLIGGLVAAGVKDGFDLFSNYVLHWTNMRYLDFTGVMIFGRNVRTLWETMFAQVAEIMFSAGVGIIFAYLILGVTSKNYLLKSWFWGVFTWFGLYSVTVLFKVKELMYVSFPTVLSHSISSTLWGIVLGLTLHWLDNKAAAVTKTEQWKTKRYFLRPAPTRKREPEDEDLKSPRKPIKVNKLKHW